MFMYLGSGSQVQPFDKILKQLHTYFACSFHEFKTKEKRKINKQHAVKLYCTDLQVQIQISQCPDVPSDRQLSCVHAVAVRARQDVFVVDFKQFWTEFTLCNDGVLNRKVERYGSYGYTVFLQNASVVIMFLTF